MTATQNKVGRKMNRSAIEWVDCWPGRTGWTWNPLTGCSIKPISPGCERCWAKRMANRQKGRNGYDLRFPFRPTWHEDRLDAPFRLKRPAAIAVVLMGDMFHGMVRAEHVLAILGMMRKCYWHRFFVLTKRPEVLKQFMAKHRDRPEVKNWPYPNVAVGVSVEDQERADERIPTLLSIRAEMHWVSLEQLLGPVDLARYLPHQKCDPAHPEALDFVVVGGESGAGARPMHLHWVRGVRDQCTPAKIPYMMKQWGHWTPLLEFEKDYPEKEEEAFRGRRNAVWMARDGEVWERRVPSDSERIKRGFELLAPVGKKHSGRLVDGVLEMGFPRWFGDGEGRVR